MARHKQSDRPVAKKLSLRSSIVEQVDAAFTDPLTRRPEYNSWSTLVESLLEGWLDGKFKVGIRPYSANFSDLL